MLPVMSYSRAVSKPLDADSLHAPESPLYALGSDVAELGDWALASLFGAAGPPLRTRMHLQLCRESLVSHTQRGLRPKAAFPSPGKVSLVGLGNLCHLMVKAPELESVINISVAISSL